MSSGQDGQRRYGMNVLVEPARTLAQTEIDPSYPTD